MGLPATTLAQEAPPIPLAVALSPDGGEPVMIRARDAGLVVRGLDGSWRLVCASALGVSSNANFYLQARAGGGLLVSTYQGLQHAGPAACDWAFPDPALEDVNLAHVRRRGDVLHALVARDNRYSVYRSDDAGETFAQIFELPPEAAYFKLAVAPSDPERFYFTAVTTNLDAGTTERWLYRSDDGGQSFERTPLELGDAPIVELLGVDPEDPDRIYLAFAQRLSSHSHGEEEEPMKDRLVVTEDFGRTLSTLQEVHLFGGFAFGARPSELWIGDAEGGLLRSTDRGASFETVSESLHVSCLEQRDDRLWVCADSTRDPFSVGFTDDDGASFTGVMRFDEVAGVHTCDGVPLSGCGPQWSGWTFWHKPSQGAADGGGASRADAATPVPMDSGPITTPAADPSGDGGCDCRLARGSGGTAGALPLLLALAWLGRRKSRKALP